MGAVGGFVMFGFVRGVRGRAVVVVLVVAGLLLLGLVLGWCLRERLLLQQ